MKLHTLPLLLVCILTAGCQDVVSQNEPDSTLAVLPDVRFARTPEIPPAQGLETLKLTTETVVPIFRDAAAPWQTKHRRFQPALASTPAAARSTMEQAGAVYMLASVLRTPESAEQAEVAEAYVEMLVRAQSPEVPLVAEAVARFAPTWGDTRTARIAAHAAAAGEAAMLDLAACETCGVPANVERFMRADVPKSRSVVDARLAGAVRDLRDLAE